MKLFKRKAAEPSRRQRLNQLQNSLPTSYSYHARRSETELNTGRQIQREDISRAARQAGLFGLSRVGSIILLAVGVICLVSVLSLSNNPQVTVLASQGSNQQFVQPSSVYQQAASKYFAQSVWNKNKITVDTTAISNKLTTKFPELSTVSITLPLVGHRPLITVQPAEPALILSSANGSFVVDTAGTALITASSDSATSLGVPTVTDLSGLSVALGKEVLTAADISFIKTVVSQLQAKDVAIGTLSLPAGTSELDVQISNEPYLVKFNLESGDATQQVGTYLAVADRLKSQNITPSKYIDVRLDGRAYYI